jgi:hypothetical protein
MIPSPDANGPIGFGPISQVLGLLLTTLLHPFRRQQRHARVELRLDALRLAVSGLPNQSACFLPAADQANHT